MAVNLKDRPRQLPVQHRGDDFITLNLPSDAGDAGAADILLDRRK